MDNQYHHTLPDTQQHLAYNGGYLEPPYPANRPPPSGAAHEPPRPDHTAPGWTPTRGYDGHPYGFGFPAPPAGFGGTPPFGFDPTVPPPPFGCPPPGHFPNVVTAPPINTYGASSFDTFNQQFRPQATRYDSDPSPKQQHGFQEESGAPFGRPRFPPYGKDYDKSPAPTPPRPEDETSTQRRQDQQWLVRFLQGRDKIPKTKQAPRHKVSVPDLRDTLYRAARLVTQLAESCETLRLNVEDECVWTDSYLAALKMKTELQGELRVLGDSERLDTLKAKLSRIAKRRARRQRARKMLQVENAQREELIAEKEAAINKWRMQQIQQVEERKKEQELKLAADSVLCEVRKKQADVKRMHDILRSLEKLRKLRKEAASRKGITTEQESDEAFSSRLEQLRVVMKKRTAVYSTEEKALMVMLEGEQEEERRREQERRVKKERERHLQRKSKVNAMLFGDELPAGSVLQPFKEYYTQAEHSLHALLQIRREWDAYVVPADHPDGSSVPQTWILPDPPSDPAWASALQHDDNE